METELVIKLTGLKTFKDALQGIQHAVPSDTQAKGK